MVPFSAWLLWRTRFGLRLRICGERPGAGEAQGINIYFYKYVGVIISGCLAGLGGAFIASQELSGVYKEGQTTGRGFIGLAALIFGNWRPWGIFGGAMLFGYPFALQLQDLDGKASHSLLLVTAIAMFGVMIWALIRKNTSDTVLAAVFGGGAAAVVPARRDPARLVGGDLAVRHRAGRADLLHQALASTGRRRPGVSQRRGIVALAHVCRRARRARRRRLGATGSHPPARSAGAGRSCRSPCRRRRNQRSSGTTLPSGRRRRGRRRATRRRNQDRMPRLHRSPIARSVM